MKVRFDRVDLHYLRLRAHQKWGRWDSDVISLSVADLDYPPPQEVQQAVERWLREERTPYGPPAGDPELREILARKVRRRNSIPATAEEILIIPGTMFGIFLACFLSLRPGDEAVLTPSPVYGPFWKNVRAMGATPVPHDLSLEPGFAYLKETLASRIGPKTRLLMVCNPHNPTGRVLRRDDLEAVARVALENDLTIFSDELYEDLVMEGEHISMASLGKEVLDRTITVFGFSKAFGIPGYRVAYLVVPPRLRDRAVEAMEHIMVHTDTLAQAAALGALEAGERWLKPLVEHLRDMRDRSLRRLEEMPGVACTPSQATPFLFVDVRSLGVSSEELCRRLLEEGRLVVQPGTHFGPSGEGFIRLNLATSWEVLAEAFHRMERVFHKMR
jgi:aspartate/methionine/tyrosine aminotransferase